ncbi:MAG: NAD-dependent epimerase/dehydratase family protein [Plesiomonas sp.]|uniref:NAD-dependent epimerase/dehydratase family protein n=1 Tax=Plesiomonas sp. TaxID=2486279 RepID=UPI003F3629F2
MKVLLSGASGFIGGFLHKAIPNECRCVVRRGSNNPIVHDSFEIDNSLDVNTVWDGAFDDIDVVVHLAGIAHNRKNEDILRVNTEGTLHFAREAARLGVKRFVFVSSIGVNGTSTTDKPFTCNMIAAPHNTYAQSKYEAELGLKKVSKETGLEVVIVRPTLVYGPNAPGNFGMLAKLIKKLPVLPFGLASNRRDFISVQNLVDLLIVCATHPNANGHTFLASDGETVSIKEFTNSIADGLGRKLIQLPIPIQLMQLIGKLVGKSVMIEQLLGNLEVDSSNAFEILGWVPPLTIKEAMFSLRDLGE